jgi:Rad3-related DNA helicase
MKPVSVRELASFVFRHGDLYPSGEGGRVEAWEGTLAHATLQQQRAKGDEKYRKEVALKIPATLAGQQRVLQGRIDGLTQDPDGQTVVEEYKTSRRSQPLLRPADEAQAWLYAGMLCSIDASVIDVVPRIIYISPEGVELVTYQQTLTAHTAKMFLAFVLTCFDAYLQRLDRRNRQRMAWADTLSFPHDSYRKNQRAIAGQVYKSLIQEQNLLLEAVTGSGKTLAVLFPALKAQAMDEQFFFLTSRTRGADAALDALGQLVSKTPNAPLRVVQITAKEKTCPLVKMTCDASVCPNAADYYNRVPEALSALEQQPLSGRETIESVAAEHDVCPFELSLDSAMTADVIVADYNYVFDPTVRLQRFVHQDQQSLLIDEAHQLSHRVSDMLSVTVTSEQLQLAMAASGPEPELNAALTALNEQMLRGAQSAQDQIGVKHNLRQQVTELLQSDDESHAMDEAMFGFLQTCERLMSEAGHATETTLRISGPTPVPQQLPVTDSLFQTPETMSVPQATGPGDNSKNIDRELLPEDVLQLYFTALRWHRSAKWTDPANYRYIVATEKRKRSQPPPVSVSRWCIDSSDYSSQIMAEHKAVVRFSGTLSPLSLFQRLHGQEATDASQPPTQSAAVRAQTPFQAEQLGVFAITNIETYYQRRQSSLGQLCELLATLQEVRPGRYLVAMPSYEYLAQLSEYVSADDTFMQQARAMDDETQLALLRRFQSADQATLGIVMGGVFSESVDLGPGVLSGVVVVSLALPPQDLSKTLIQGHFDDSYGQGWGRQVAYLQPALSKIVQAAGRLIRSPNDRGVVCLVDPRFANPTLHNYFPEHWQVESTTTENLKNRLKTFWLHDLLRRED